jgi:hypothetical protein
MVLQGIPEYGWTMHSNYFTLKFAFPVVVCGAKLMGNDVYQYTNNVQKGFWEFDGCDPNKCGALEVSAPIGAWASCEC